MLSAYCLMKSFVGQAQLKRGCSGTILTAINQDELSAIVLPKIPDEIQEKIANKITSMYEQKSLAKKMLEIAKIGVETAIEQDETKAIKWMKEATQKLYDVY